MEEVLDTIEQEIDTRGFIFKPVVVEELPLIVENEEAHLKSIKLGESIKEYLLRNSVEEENLIYFIALKNASIISLDYVPRLGDSLLVAAQPGFGGLGHIFHSITNAVGHIVSPIVKPISSILGPQLTSYALMAAGAYFGGAFGGANLIGEGISYGASALGVSGQIAGTLASYSSTIGSFLATSIGGSIVQASMGSAPVQQISSSGGYKESQSYSLFGQSNQAKQMAPCTIVYGTRKVFPPIAVFPETMVRGESTEIRSLMDIGIGEYTVKDIKIGDTPIDDLTKDYNVENHTATPNLRWLDAVENYVSQAFVVKPGTDWISQTKQNTDRALVVFTFPRGLYHQKDDGNLEDSSVQLQVYYKDATNTADTWHRVDAPQWSGLTSVAQDGDWVKASDHFTRVKFLTADIRFPNSGIWDVKAVCNTAEATDSRTNNQVQVSALINVEDHARGIVSPKLPHTWLEVRAQSSEKLSGALNNITAVVTSKLRWHNGTAWQPKKETSNPAWVVLDILTGEGNDEPLRDDQIDFQSFVDFAAVCDQDVNNTINGVTSTTKRFQCNMVVDMAMTVGELINGILSESRAHIHLNSAGKYAVVMDKEQTQVKQVFSPSNSWGFSGTRGFVEEIHAFKVQWTNPQRNWIREEVLVYNDGYSQANSTNIKELSTLAITSYQEAWRFGRYQLALSRHQQEMFKLNCEAEHLSIDIGDLVEFAFDVPKVGGYSTYVKDISGTTVTVSDQIEWPVDPYFVLRRVDGLVIRGKIKTALTSNQFEPDVALPLVKNGDLLVIGEKDHVVKQYTVKDITINDGFTASLTLVPYVKAIYDADQGKIPDWDSGLIPGQKPVTNLEVHNIVFSYTDRQVGLDPVTTVTAHWDVTGNRANLQNYLIEAIVPGLKPQVLGRATGEAFSFEVNQFTDKTFMNGAGQIKITPISKLGATGLPETATPVIPKFNTIPATPVLTLKVDPATGRGTFDWSTSNKDFVRSWEIRRINGTQPGDWNTNTHAVGVFDRDTTSFNLQLQSGLYMIKAIGLIPGLESAGHDDEFVDIHMLPQNMKLQAIKPEETGWGGTKDNFTVVGSSLNANLNPGTIARYEYEITDLGSIQTFEATQNVQLAAGKMSVMHDWTPLSIAQPLEYIIPAGANTYTSWVEMRTSRDDPALNPNGWTPWMHMISTTQATGQYVQFRLNFVTTVNNTEVIIGSGEIDLNAPSRKETFLGVAVTGTKSFTFNKKFAAAPYVSTIVVSKHDVVVKVLNITNAGFDIRVETLTGQLETNPVTINIVADGFGVIH